MKVINNQLFNTTESMQTEKPDEFPSFSECKLSSPKFYKAKTAPAWIITVCSEIWTRLLSTRKPESCLTETQNQISGAELVSNFMADENKTDRNLICGVWQLLLDERAIEPILSSNQDENINPIEFYDRNDVFYVRSRLKDKRLSIEEALATTEICPNVTGSNKEDYETLEFRKRTSNAQNTHNSSCEKNNEHVDVDDANSVEDCYRVLIERLYRLAPEALFRKILQKLPSCRTENELEYVYQELLLVPALSSFSMSVRQELCKCLSYEVHENATDIVFYQGDPGISWYIIYRGSVWVHVNDQGYVCRLSEGDDFGKLALITDKPRAASILLAEDNCHFLKLEKDDFNRILRNVEANTVRLKKNNFDVLILERIPDVKLPLYSQTEMSHDNIKNESHKMTCFNYSIIAGTVEQILYYLLESRLNGLDNQLHFLISDELFPPYLCPHSPINIDQTWQNFFLTYTLFTTNKEILLFLYEYLGCDKSLESIHHNPTEQYENNNNSTNNYNNTNEYHHWQFPNNFQFNITKVGRVIVLFYIWRYCVGLLMFADQIEVNQFVVNLKTALNNIYSIQTTTENIIHNELDNPQDLQLHLTCLDKLIKQNAKLMTIKPTSDKQHTLSPNFLHFPCNFLRTLPFVGNTKRGIIKLNKTQLSNSGEHSDSFIATDKTIKDNVKSFEIRDTSTIHNIPTDQHYTELKSSHISTPSLLFGFHIFPSTLPLIKAIHTITFKVYVTELQKQIDITAPIESTVYEIKQLLLSEWEMKSDINELKMIEVFSKGEWIVYQDNECGIMFGLSPNGRLFLTPENAVQSLVPLAEQLTVTMNFLEISEADRVRNSHQHETTSYWNLKNDILLLKKNRSIRASVRLLDELNIDELATTLSCCHVQLAVCIHPQELLDYVIGGCKVNKPCPHIRTLVRRFSLLHAWTITQIVTTCNLTRRANLIKKLIKLADRLVSPPLCDLYSSFAIILGLQSSSITRLTHTWERVPNRWRRILNNNLLPLTDPSKNHRTARLWNNYNNKNPTNCNTPSTPRLPFLALILKDLRFGEDANQTDYHKSEGGIRLINFEKMRLIAGSLRSWVNSISGYELIHSHNQLISSEITKMKYSVMTNVTVQKLLEVPNDSQMFVLEHLECIDDPRVIAELSLRLEPKK
ncbi:unnamed protein product [Schistosoma turkestanicum]|nr:unnamed protein product [Schistosoma turkestanicum]